MRASNDASWRWSAGSGLQSRPGYAAPDYRRTKGALRGTRANRSIHRNGHRPFDGRFPAFRFQDLRQGGNQSSELQYAGELAQAETACEKDAVSQPFEAEAPFDKLHYAIALLVQTEPSVEKAISVIQELIDESVKKAEEPWESTVASLEAKLDECRAQLKTCERLADGDLNGRQLKTEDRCYAVNSVESLVERYLELKDAASDLVSEASAVAEGYSLQDGNTNALDRSLRLIGRLI